VPWAALAGAPAENGRVTLCQRRNAATVAKPGPAPPGVTPNVLLLTLGNGSGRWAGCWAGACSPAMVARLRPGLIGAGSGWASPCNSGNRGFPGAVTAASAGLAGLQPLDLRPNSAAAPMRVGRSPWPSGGIMGACWEWGSVSLIYVLTRGGNGLARRLASAAPATTFLPALWREKVGGAVLPESRPKALQIRRWPWGNGAGRLGAAKLALDRWEWMVPFCS